MIERIRELYHEDEALDFSSLKFSQRFKYYKDGDRGAMETPYFYRRRSLSALSVLALLEPENEKYIERINDLAFAICDEYSWGLPAHTPTEGDIASDPYVVDLFNGETAAMLAALTYVLGDRLHPVVKARAEAEVRRRVIEPFKAKFQPGEMGGNNWSTVVGGSAAICFYLLDRESFRTVLPRFKDSMDDFIASYTDDGTCTEGFGRTAKGTHINNVLDLSEGEKITAMISIHEFVEGEYLTMVTKQGIIKRTLLTEYEYQRKGGKIALSLKDDDELVFVTHTYGYPTDLMIATRHGSAVRFTVDDESVRPMGRTATGVRGIKLRGDDYVVGVASVVEGKSLITITENGYGKRTDFDDFRQMKHRGGHGVACHALSEKTGLLSGINIVDDNDDVMIITDAGTMIRTGAADIPTYSRSAGGVRVMRLAEGQKIVNFTKIARQDELEEVVQPSEELSGEETEPTEVVLEEVAEEVIPEEPEEAAEQAEDNQDA